jgi:hypothetical protein
LVVLLSSLSFSSSNNEEINPVTIFFSLLLSSSFEASSFEDSFFEASSLEASSFEELTLLTYTEEIDEEGEPDEFDDFLDFIIINFFIIFL